MVVVEIPGPMRFVAAAIGSWWLGEIVNPGFHPIAFMLILMIPVVIIELYFYIDEQGEKSKSNTVEPESSAELLD